MILGIFAAALRLVFLSSPKVQPIQPDQQEVATHYVSQQAVTNQDSAGAEDAQSFGESYRGLLQKGVSKRSASCQ